MQNWKFRSENFRFLIRGALFENGDEVFDTRKQRSSSEEEERIVPPTRAERLTEKRNLLQRVFAFGCVRAVTTTGSFVDVVFVFLYACGVKEETSSSSSARRKRNNNDGKKLKVFQNQNLVAGCCHLFGR